MNRNSIKNKIGIFITGATGFIGSNLVLKLMSEDMYKIFCLVRPKNDPQQRLKNAIFESAKSAGLLEIANSNISDVVAISGDLTIPMLGISDSDMEMINDYGIEHMWHCAASLRYEEEHKTEIFSQNIEGTKNTVDVAKYLCVKEFNYISTSYVAGKKTGTISEDYYDNSYEPNNCYEESKRMAEEITLSGEIEGLFHLRIFRPSIVIGNTKTYDSTSTSGYYGFVYALNKYIRLISNMPEHFDDKPLIMLYREQGATLNLVPIDLLVDEAIAISKENNASPEFHHLTNPYPVNIDLAWSALNDLYPGVEMLVTDDERRLSKFDKVFKNKTDFYNPYLMNDKIFEHRRDADLLLKKINFDKSDLINFTKESMRRYNN